MILRPEDVHNHVRPLSSAPSRGKESDTQNTLFIDIYWKLLKEMKPAERGRPDKGAQIV